ncbi:MAG: WecB/TagA/CpsF family glycosyltransferase [Burkholderiales bacterium]|nr:WecB/TagA/CpsF family glycosyltransferase [Phycisphaerae bacterium]
MDLARLPVVRLKGVELHAITEKQCIAHILAALDAGEGGTVVTPNLDIIRRCRSDLNFASLVSEASLVVADGMPLVWASRLQGTPLPQRVPGSDLITSLSIAAAERGRSVFLLGGDDGVATRAAEALRIRAPKLKIAGTYRPPFGFEKSDEEMRRIIDAVTLAQPDIVWVALGSPKQEFLINRIRKVLPGAWWLGVGISFSFLAGSVQRAPRWAQLLGLEWLHRVKQEPKRLFRRYFVDGIPFALSLLCSAAANRLAGLSEENTVGHRHRKHDSDADDIASHRRAFAKSASAKQFRADEESLENSEDLPSPLDTSETDSGAGDSDTGDSDTGDSSAGDAIHSGRPHEISMARGLKRLKAIILLGGKVRQSPLSLAIGRSVLDLPLDENGSILNHWASQSTELMRRVGIESLLVRVMVDQNSHAPVSIDPQYANLVRVERDRSSFRGTGGLIADIAADYADDDLLLIGNASQILLDPLWAIAAALDHKTGDFTLISHRDGTASGLMLLSCKTVRAISSVGYVDLKEQALPKIARDHDVRVVHCRQPTGLPLFSLSDYIGALQRYYHRKERRRARTNPLSEEVSRRFTLVEKGATVSPEAYLHDAVVLRGATVEPGTAAIRSLIGPNVTLRRGRMVTDQLLGAL